METNEVNNDIGDRIRAERERLALTQAAMAEKAGVSRATQVNYESGKRMPDMDYLQKLGALGGDVGYLLTGIPTTADTIERRALLKTLSAICDRLDIDYIGVLEAAYEEAGQVPRTTTKAIRDKQAAVLAPYKEAGFKYQKERYLTDSRESISRPRRTGTRWIAG